MQPAWSVFNMYSYFFPMLVFVQLLKRLHTRIPFSSQQTEGYRLENILAKFI